MTETDKINFKLPNGDIEIECGYSIVFIGGNGSGKSRLGVWIEKENNFLTNNFLDSKNDEEIMKEIKNEENIMLYRIPAQRLLSLSDNGIAIKPSNNILREFFCLKQFNDTSYLMDPYIKTFKNGYDIASKQINNFNELLNCFMSVNTENRERIGFYPTQDEIKKIPYEKLKRIWKLVLPDLELKLEGATFNCIKNGSEYHIKNMSDGERYVLYIIMLAIVLPKKCIILIDEPETFLHKSIINKFWDEIEKLRKDCVFIYITHDLDFALKRSPKKLYHLKGFKIENKDIEGNNEIDKKEIFDYEEKDYKGETYDKIDTELLLEVLGTKNKYIFVEGTEDSLDYILYKNLYSSDNFNIVPCGSCKKVKQLIAAKDQYAKFSNNEFFGIIDRDYMTDKEIQSFDKNLLTLNVAEVENLFIVPELLDFLEEKYDEDEKAKEAKNKIIDLFKQNLNAQIKNQYESEIKHQIKSNSLISNIQLNNNKIIKESIINEFSSIIDTINEFNMESRFKYDDSLDLNSKYREVLKVFNDKKLIKEVSKIFFNDKDKLKEKIKNILIKDSADREEIICILRKYCPEINVNTAMSVE